MSTSPPLPGHERRRRIVNQLRDRGSVRVNELASTLGVSNMTVRRDLQNLADAGLAVKVHGGATLPLRRSAEEPGFAAKAERNNAEKVAIARACSSFVAPGWAIGITGGTTTAEICPLLSHVDGLTVVTNSLAVSRALHGQERANLTVILTGGERTPSDALVGPVAIASLTNFHLDLLFMGVHGMHPTAGFTTPNLLEAETNRAFIAAAAQLVVAADRTKWNLAGLTTVVPLATADVVVSDDGLEDEVAETIRASGPKVVRATALGST